MRVEVRSARLWVLALGPLLLPGGVAWAQTTCTKTITTLPYTITLGGNYCLGSNLQTSLATGSAITINADGVVLDLAGFKLEDTSALGTITTNGVSVANRRDVTIRNGTIRGFYRGVYVTSAGSGVGCLVEEVLAESNKYAGIWVEGTAAVVRNSRVANTTGTAVLVEGSSDTWGIHLVGFAARAVNNDVLGTVGMGSGMGRAIALEQAEGGVAEGNRVANLAAGNSVGVDVLGGGNALVVDNVLTGLGWGVSYEGESGGKYRDNLTSGVGTPYSGGSDAGNNQ
jgi:hypothetical protein